jgi:hypothetical protein
MDWEEVKKNVQKGAEVAVEKVSQYSRIGKLKMDQLILKRKIEKNYTAIGLSVYEYLKERKGESVPASILDEFICEIDNTQVEINEIEDDITKIKKEGKSDTNSAS